MPDVVFLPIRQQFKLSIFNLSSLRRGKHCVSKELYDCAAILGCRSFFYKYFAPMVLLFMHLFNTAFPNITQYFKLPHSGSPFSVLRSPVFVLLSSFSVP
jgi:hypothetical protein